MDQFEERAAKRLDEWPDIDKPAFAASFTLFRLATQYLTWLESSVHRHHGVSTAGFRVLFTVWVYDEIEPRHIATLSGVSTAAVSGVVNTLEAKELVHKARAESDGRLVLVTLTEGGERLLRDLYTQQNRHEQELFGELPAKELETLTQLLRSLLVSLP